MMTISKASARWPSPTLFARPVGTGVRARTFDRLMCAAVRMTSRGQIPSVTDLAVAAGVSRATAYRYFPSRSTLISAVIEESLRPVRHWTSPAADGAQRIDDLFERTLPRFKEYEAQMRAALQLALEHWSAERAGSLDKTPFRRGFRRAILERNAAPLRGQLGRKAFDRLLKALSLVYGIESFVVLKDIWGARESEIEGIVRWVAAALVAASLAETGKRRPHACHPASERST